MMFKREELNPKLDANIIRSKPVIKNHGWLRFQVAHNMNLIFFHPIHIFTNVSQFRIGVLHLRCKHGLRPRIINRAVIYI
ncbi:hypothetical protein D3C77_762960 [compost metagenome]